jgi:NTP pyrophosphatase (non-canonical NTP hydrolase)
MDLREYQLKSRETAVYPNIGNNRVYPILGLLGEFGEIAEKVKKIERDKADVYDPDSLHSLLMECGDVAWYIAQIASELKIDLAGCKPQGLYSVTTIRDCVISLGVRIGDLAGAAHYGDYLKAEAYMTRTIASLAGVTHLFGKPLDEVLDMNIEKLQSRKARGVLHGSGDER